ncbi:MAG: hypothetical protein ACTSYW_00475 [Candidatus Heimdallarchaeota archaeon]
MNETIVILVIVGCIFLGLIWILCFYDGGKPARRYREHMERLQKKR